MLRPRPATRREGFITRRFLFGLGAALFSLIPAVLIPVYGDAIYLSLTGISGEVTTKGFEKTIAITSLDWKTTRPIIWQQMGDFAVPQFGMVQISDVSGAKAIDSTSAFLFERTTGLQVITTAKFTIMTDAGLRKLELEFTNARFTSLGQSASTGSGALANEKFTLFFEKVKITPYSTTGVAGTPKTWDVSAGQP